MTLGSLPFHQPWSQHTPPLLQDCHQSPWILTVQSLRQHTSHMPQTRKRRKSIIVSLVNSFFIVFGFLSYSCLSPLIRNNLSCHMNMPDVKVEVSIFTLYMHFAPTPSTAVSAHLTTASLLFLIIGIFFFYCKCRHYFH